MFDTVASTGYTGYTGVLTNDWSRARAREMSVSIK
jgi:hypothetical protein